MSETRPNEQSLRFDLGIIASWIKPGSRVLGLGCGDGELLHYLTTRRNAICTGIDHNEKMVMTCIQKGLSVLQGDINEEVLDYPDSAFDYVILSRTLQQVYEPAGLIRSMLRIGKKCVVSFPNFSHWRIRFQLLATGHAPVTRQLPYEWYDTPNIRVITIRDFRKFTREAGLTIFREVAIDTRYRGRIIKIMPEWLATYGIFLIGKDVE